MTATRSKRFLSSCFLFFLPATCWIASPASTHAFVVVSLSNPRTTTLWSRGRDGSFDASDTQLLQERLTEIRRSVLEEEVRRPPNPNLTPQEFVAELLQALYNNGDPLPDSGFRSLLRSSTKSWRRELYRAVAAPQTADEEPVASALGEAMGRPHNQFAILVGEDELFEISFPTEPLDYGDGSCWLECTLRDAKNGQLLVVTGWSLLQRSTDGSWLVDRIDWQDFREEFRPGIGREEWMRLVGD